MRLEISLPSGVNVHHVRHFLLREVWQELEEKLKVVCWVRGSNCSELMIQSDRSELSCHLQIQIESHQITFISQRRALPREVSAVLQAVFHAHFPEPELVC